MAEVYPTDSELMDMISEAETGVEFIPTGTAPYFIHFRKLLHRLLLATKRANDLRVYDEGGLTFGVKPGKFWYDKTLHDFAGVSGVDLASNQASIFIYMDWRGDLVTDEYVSFPDMEAEVHIRLAIISTSGDDITSITDCRDHHSISTPTLNGIPSQNSKVVAYHDDDYALQHAETGSVHTNLIATGPIRFILPGSVMEGTEYTFVVCSMNVLEIDPIGLNLRVWPNGGISQHTISSDVVGSHVTLISDGTGNWLPTSMSDNWIDNP
jgi:hypothetical protein